MRLSRLPKHGETTNKTTGIAQSRQPLRDFAEACEEMFSAHDAFHAYCAKAKTRNADGTHVPDATSQNLWSEYVEAEERAKLLRDLYLATREPTEQKA